MNERQGNAHRYSSFARVFRLARKELREILRDRRTIVTLVAMPLLLYPLMSIVFKQMYLANRPVSERGRGYRIGHLTSDEFNVFQYRFYLGVQQRLADAGKPLTLKGGLLNPSAPHLVAFPDAVRPESRSAEERKEALERFQEELRKDTIDLVIVIPDLKQRIEDGVPLKDEEWTCEIHYVPTFARGRAALAEVEACFAAANERNLRQRLGARGVTPRIRLLHMRPMAIDVPDTGTVSLAALVPLILILMTITGAVYPAIDLTAGERERGTLEILVAAPVSRFELLSAKYLSVLAVAILTALVNLTCMMATVSWSGLGAALFQNQEFSLPILLQILALLLLFAAFFSALLLCLTSFARSFKEAQAYLIPLMLASLTPGVMAMLPGLKLTGILTVLPLVNVVLMARDLFSPEGVPPLTAATIVLTTLIYALAALALAARVFGAESVLYSEQSSWADLLRRPDEAQPSASIPAVLWCLALMVPSQFALLALVRSFAVGSSHATQMVLGILVNLLLFGCLPSLFLYVGRVDVVRGLRMSRPRAAGVLAGVILGLSLWPIQLGMMQLLESSEMFQAAREVYVAVLQSMRDARLGLGWGVLAAVIVPAILEEFFFRGLLFEALRRRLPPLATIGISGLLFGVTHVILGGELGLLRLIPSSVLGLVLSTICWYAGNLWPCVILHVCHNAILMIVGVGAEPGTTEEIPVTWLAGGVVGTSIGGFVLWMWGGKSDRIMAGRSS